VAGLIGVIVTLILSVPINIIVHALSGVTDIASLPPLSGLALVGISMSLTFIAGLFPARFAAKKDPVVALRTE
jgi:putative ABC transport system permease protein